MSTIHSAVASGHSLGYGQCALEIVQIINQGASIKHLDKPTLLWVLEQVDVLRQANNARGEALRSPRKDTAA